MVTNAPDWGWLHAETRRSIYPSTNAPNEIQFKILPGVPKDVGVLITTEN